VELTDIVVTVYKNLIVFNVLHVDCTVLRIYDSAFFK
jgi:hypothetical protein